MTKPELAKQLRILTLETGNVTKEEINSVNDDDMINCFNTCSCCGEKYLSSIDLELAIKSANSADEFIAISKGLEYKRKVETKN